MEAWIFFIFISEFIWAVTAIIDKFVLSKGYIRSAMVYIILNGLMNVLIIFLLPFVQFSSIGNIDILIAISNGIFLSLGVVLFYTAIQNEEVSRVSMMFTLIPVFVLILAFFILDEVLTLFHYIGFVLLVSASILASYHHSKKKWVMNKAFYFMLASAIFIAFSWIAGKHILSITNFWNAFLWLRLTNFVTLGLLFVPSIRNEFINTFRKMNNKIRGLLGFKMVVDFSAFAISNLGIFFGTATLTSALAGSISPLLIFTLAILASIFIPKIIKEELDFDSILIKTASLILVIIGIIFINL
ncbi:hypothetical protein CMO83_00095 [Candidatus Woesearchaeota archaeon]|jgi:uncharacterized membrane protein|nr:hypothetical protein [Candidatus Woesearchaeota archaeon]|tara:strand:+ start:43477 stop:44376 length:900 start_codon:yes stop_codon:yes gene_type:complete